MPDYLRKEILMDVRRDGTLTLRREGESLEAEALPIYSTDTEEQARNLQAMFCRLMYNGQYVLKDFKGTLSDMDRMSEVFAAEEDKINVKA